jgi:hypothetical protein|tara:strand:+ start:2688 stop:2954 length:267 start_codon:yes stop_codon:yes gene_type:complete
MKQKLWIKFLNKNLVKHGTRVYAKVTSKGFSQENIEIMKELSVTDANEDGGIGHFVRDHRENFTFNYGSVEEVDSMTPERLAKAYKIK